MQLASRQINSRNSPTLMVQTISRILRKTHMEATRAIIRVFPPYRILLLKPPRFNNPLPNSQNREEANQIQGKDKALVEDTIRTKEVKRRILRKNPRLRWILRIFSTHYKSNHRVGQTKVALEDLLAKPAAKSQDKSLMKKTSTIEEAREETNPRLALEGAKDPWTVPRLMKRKVKTSLRPLPLRK